MGLFTFLLSPLDPPMQVMSTLLLRELGIMEKKLETVMLNWGNIGIMEKRRWKLLHFIGVILG